MCSRSSRCTLSSPDTCMSHTRHSSSHAAVWRSNAAAKSAWRSRRPGRPHQRVTDRRIPRRVERHHLLDPHRRSLLHVEGEDLLDIVLHLIQPPLDLEALISSENACAGRMADVQIRLPGLGLQRVTSDPNVRGETGFRWRPSSCRWRTTPPLLHPAVDRRNHLDAPRPVLRNQRPLDPRVMRVAHADEPAAVQCHLPGR